MDAREGERGSATDGEVRQTDGDERFEDVCLQFYDRHCSSSLDQPQDRTGKNLLMQRGNACHRARRVCRGLRNHPNASNTIDPSNFFQYKWPSISCISPSLTLRSHSILMASRVWIPSRRRIRSNLVLGNRGSGNVRLVSSKRVDLKRHPIKQALFGFIFEHFWTNKNQTFIL